MGALASTRSSSVGLLDSFERLFARLDDPAIARPVYWAALALLLAIIQFPFGWTGTEENYFQLAHRWVRPDAFGPFSAAFDQSSGKFTAFWLYGQLIHLLGYDGAHAVLTAIVIPFMAFALLRLSLLLGLSPVDTTAVVGTYLVAGQALMGGEGFMGVVDPKVFSYAFGILAFAEAGSVRSRWPLVAILSALAVYFHFQIGGLWFAISLLLMLATSGSWRGPLLTAPLVLLLIAPVPIALFSDHMRFSATVRPEGMPSADYIYGVLRAPHHLAPFAETGGWKKLAARGLGYSLVIAAGAIYAIRERNRPLRGVGIVVLALAVYQFVAVGLSWFDRGTLSLGKFYLFRPAATLLLLALFMMAALWRTRTINSPGVRLLPMAAIVALFFVQVGSRTLSGQLAPFDPATRSMVEEVRKRTSASDPILLDTALDGRLSLIRKLSRQTVVTWKFVPTNPPDIYRWWGFMQRREQTFSGDCSKAEPARFLVAIAVRTELARCGRIVWSNEHYILIEIERAKGAIADS